MRVLYLCPSPYLGVRDRSGWSTHISAMITGLREHGHSVTPYLAASHRAPSRPGSRSHRELVKEVLGGPGTLAKGAATARDFRIAFGV